MTPPVPIYIGYDPRESAAYHVFCQSVIERSSIPVSFIPLHKGLLGGFDGQKDGSNAFIYSRFLVPYLQNYQGWALFVDGDMTCLGDIAELWAQREVNVFDRAVCVVKHDYQTAHPRKYIGTPMEAKNEDYPRKNHSSVILWNCSHYRNRILNPQTVAERPGSELHRFRWLTDEQVGALPPEWNVLVGEQPIPANPKLLHYTLGIPGIPHYSDWEGAEAWYRSAKNAMHIEGC